MTIDKKLGEPWAFYMKLDDKQNWLAYLRQVVKAFYAKYSVYPSKITLNPQEIEKAIGKYKGIIMGNQRISIFSDKTCISKHSKLFL